MRRRFLAMLVFATAAGVPWDSSRGAEAIETPPPEMLKLRDPFRRPEMLQGDGTPRTELETYPIEQLKLMGVTSGPEKVKAMISAPNGKTYFVSQGVKIGVRRGVIRRITTDSISIREKIVNVLGQEEEVDSELKLPSATKSDLNAH